MIDNSRILVIPDLHLPYGHPDAFDFLSKINKLLQPTRVICLGDEVDFHSLSFHSSDPDLDSAGKELQKAVGQVEYLKNIFPVMELCESNHGSMVYRKAKFNNMPRHVLRSYNEVLGVDDGWSWHESIILTLPNGRRCKFIHSASPNVLLASQTAGMSLVQGHYHSLFDCRFWDGGDGVHFAITSGCLIDYISYAFAYAKNQLKRQQLGVTFIENSIPNLILMIVDQDNRWIGTRI